MPFPSIPAGQPVTRRDKRRLALIGAIVAVILAGVGIWAAVRPGSYGASRNGCITVTVPSTTGGALLHACGQRARTVCHRAYAGDGPAPRLTTRQCRLAGIAPPAAPTTPAAG
jgi:hypothetical protein